MEMCDTFYRDGTPTGKTVPRGTRLPQGECFLVVQVWIRNKQGDYLIQQRALHLKSSPGVWATTSGYVQTEEQSMDGAIREVREELGIEVSPLQLKYFDRLQTDYRLEDIWIGEVANDTIPNIGTEVHDCRWVSKPELNQMVERGEFFRYSYFDRLPD